jgi:Flp pilus assembly protein TadG
MRGTIMDQGLALARRLHRDAKGATAVEFAAVAPALLMVLLGVMDLGYNIYATTLLEGAVHRAGRDATIEGAETRGLAIDNNVRDAVGDIVPNATVEFDRRAYIDYSEVDQPEEFTDTNDDGVCNAGEPFEDVNGNGSWDEDRGRDDMGGARDAVLYTVTISYPRAFPVMNLLGFSRTVTARSRTVLRNQPYGPQNQAATVGNCS